MKYKLGDLIIQSDERNSELSYSINNVKGISIKKEFIETKAKMDGVSLKPYKVVPPGYFAYVTVTSRNSEKITLAYNDTDNTYIVSSSYIVFEVDKKNILLAEYLFMFFNRPEFDRLARFNSWGSARETFTWEDMCDLKIIIPPIDIQKKYVNVYKSLESNLYSYEKGTEDLKLVCDATLDKFKKTIPYVTIGELLSEVDERNIDNKISDVQGINIKKEFMPSNSSSKNLSNYKIINQGEFAYSSMQTGRDKTIRIALYNKENPAIISPAYSVLTVDTERIIPEYFMMWFSRAESDRYGWFISDSSIRASLDLPRFYEITIPLPNLEQQKSIVEIYNSYIIRKEIAVLLKNKIKSICPVLIKGSVEEAKEYEKV